MTRVIRHANTLFLAGGSNDVLRLYSAEGFAALVPIAAWRERLAARQAFFASLNLPWRMLLAPEKLSIHPDAPLPPGSLPPAQRLRAQLDHPALIDPAATLRHLGPSAYAQTDSHWLPHGAATACHTLLHSLGIPFDPALPAALPARDVQFHGDLWGAEHADLPPDHFPRRALPPMVQRIHTNRIVAYKEAHGLENEAGLHTGSHVIWRNTAAPRPERVVLFGSSFSEYRAECTLLSFMAAITFAEVHFVWSADLDLGLIRRIAPDIALLEMPERFLTHCPRDDFDLAAQEALVLARYEGAPGSSSSSSC